MLADRELYMRARQIRLDCAEMFHNSHTGHFGGCYSCAEILATLYFDVLNVDPARPAWPERDRFVLSKGHAAPALYSALQQRGFFPRSYIRRYETLCAELSTHPNMLKVPGVDISSGSLGHGLSVGVGMALAAKRDASPYATFVLLGDGECDEGMIWEGAMAAGHLHLDNLMVIVDRNRLCVSGDTEKVMALEPLADKWRDFSFDVYETDGHDVAQLRQTFSSMHAKRNGKPQCLIAHTVKGKGVSFMENNVQWHGAHFDDACYARIVAELTGGASAQ